MLLVMMYCPLEGEYFCSSLKLCTRCAIFDRHGQEGPVFALKLVWLCMHLYWYNIIVFSISHVLGIVVQVKKSHYDIA